MREQMLQINEPKDKRNLPNKMTRIAQRTLMKLNEIVKFQMKTENAPSFLDTLTRKAASLFFVLTAIFHFAQLINELIQSSF